MKDFEKQLKDIISAKLSDESLNNVVGGVDEGDETTYKLTYMGEDLPMDSTLAELSKTYSQLTKYKSMLVMYGMGYLWNMTLNELCEKFGQEFIQNLIDSSLA